MTERILYHCSEVPRPRWRLRCVWTFLLTETHLFWKIFQARFVSTNHLLQLQYRERDNGSCLLGAFVPSLLPPHCPAARDTLGPPRGSVSSLLPGGAWMRAAPASREQVGEVALSCSSIIISCCCCRRRVLTCSRQLQVTSSVRRKK